MEAGAGGARRLHASDGGGLRGRGYGKRRVLAGRRFRLDGNPDLPELAHDPVGGAVVVLVELRHGVDGLESDEFGQRVLNKGQLCLEGCAGLVRGRDCVICHGIQGNAFPKVASLALKGCEC